MRLLNNMENTCLNYYSVENAILNINRSVLQELWILPVFCFYMIVMSQRQIPSEMK